MDGARSRGEAEGKASGLAVQVKAGKGLGKQEEAARTSRRGQLCPHQDSGVQNVRRRSVLLSVTCHGSLGRRKYALCHQLVGDTASLLLGSTLTSPPLLFQVHSVILGPIPRPVCTGPYRGRGLVSVLHLLGFH